VGITEGAAIEECPPPSRMDEGAEGLEPRGTRRYVRGSSLLLLGRFISIVLNFGVQVLAVRYLAKEDYGAFAYALGVATLGCNFVLVGLARGIPRLVPVYRERGDEARAFGSIVLAVGTIWALGLSLILALYLAGGSLASGARLDPESLSLLLILIALVPLDAFDNLLQQLAAVFCSARAIFLRRQVLGPGFKLASVLLVIVTGGDVHLLARGYVFGSCLGVSLYITLLVREWKRQGLLRHLRPGAFHLPFREVYAFSIPLMSFELSVALRGSVTLIMLQYFSGPASVAEYRAVSSVAGLNTVVFDAFAFLFVPLASRMFARNDHDGIGNLYWTTSVWIAVLTLPVFVVTSLLAPSITVLVFGERYAAAATVLAILAVGNYVHAAFGFNGSMLSVHGKTGLVVGVNGLAALSSVVLGLALIPRYGAVGAAFSTSLALIFHNMFAHAGLWIGRTRVRLFVWPCVRVYLLIAAMTAAIAVCQWLVGPPVPVIAALAVAICLVAVRVARRLLDPRAVFPELWRISLLRWLLA